MSELDETKPYPLHPICAAFPRLDGRAMDALERDIASRGQKEPILVWEGQVIDGQNRQAACIGAGISPEYKEFDGTEEMAIREAISRNALRRHLDESQRAMIAARLARLKRGRPSGEEDDKYANLRIYSADEAAKVFNVSPRSIVSARMVIAQGIPDLVGKVDAGEMAVSVAAKLAGKEIPDQARALEAMLKGAKPAVAVRQAERDVRMRGLAGKTRALPAGKYSIIYADPPWEWEAWGPGGESKNPENHYPTLSVEAIQALMIEEMAATDGALFLWATAPLLPDALATMAAWGFVYKSLWGWDKVDPGTGYWGRSQLELLLIGTRGEFPAPAPQDRSSNLYRQAKGAHSAKPIWFAEKLEALYPDLPKIELFRRGPARPGWDAWGNEVPPGDGAGDGDGGL